MVVTMMIDLHTHILPNIDDGADSVEEALKLTKSLYSQNVTTAVCTPHFDPTQISLQEFVSKRMQAMDLMRDSKITLIQASETVLHEYLFHYSDLSKLCVENTRYLLIELPYEKTWDIKNFDMLEHLIIYYDVIPIIAHIERYRSRIKRVSYIKKLIKIGCVIQLNTTSVLDKKCKNKAIRYIKKGCIDVLGSDCHNMEERPPVIADAYDMIMQILGGKDCERLKNNAWCIVKGIRLREKKVYMIK